MMNLAEANANFPIVFQIFFFCVGACVGSFLNVCVSRLQKGESIVSPPSHCDCGTPIKFYQNIPVLSWFLLRGRAACCGRKLSLRHPLIETLSGLLFLGMWILLPADLAGVGMAFATLMLFCALFDFDTMTLPDFATVGGTILGFTLSVIFPAMQNVQTDSLPWIGSAMAGGIASAVGVIVGAGVVYWVRLLGTIAFRKEAMGEGDIILAACVGAFCGWQGAIFSVFGGALIGSIVMLPLMLIASLFSSKSDDTNGEEEGATSIPFGPWIALGGVLYLMFFSAWVDSYFEVVKSIFFK